MNIEGEVLDNVKLHQEIVGSPLYGDLCATSDINFSVLQLSTYNEN